jgi:hypothetical protein
MDEGGSGNGASLSEEATWRRPREAPSLGTLEDMSRNSPDRGISLHGVPFQPRETWYMGGGPPIPGTLIGE